MSSTKTTLLKMPRTMSSTKTTLLKMPRTVSSTKTTLPKMPRIICWITHERHCHTRVSYCSTTRSELAPN